MSEEPSAVQIVKIDNNKKIQLDVEAFSKIFLQDDVRNRPVAMISITGPFRKGKSFLLNHFLRYLQASNNEEEKAKVFSESPFDPYYNLPLNGFNWRSGAHPDTKGILIWSKPFITKLINKNGIEEEVAVLLMDTEGAFDGQHTQAHSTKLFSLVALLSSVFILNVFHQLQEDNVDMVDVFSAYSFMMNQTSQTTNLNTYSQSIQSSNSDEIQNTTAEFPDKFFQQLIFLVRDWSSPIDYNYGFKGGASLLAKHQLKAVNRSIEDLPEELKRIRNRLIDKYEKIDCFLMPLPGKLVSVQQKEGVFEGQIAFYDNDFLISLKEFVTKLLEGNFLQTKRIGGCNITGEHMLEYFKQLAQLLESDTLPEPKVMVETMGEIINNNAAKETLEEYKNMLILLAGPEVPHIKSAVLKEKNEEFVKICLTKFDFKPKLSFPLVKEKLENDMISLFKTYEEMNIQKKFSYKIKNIVTSGVAQVSATAGAVVGAASTAACYAAAVSPAVSVAIPCGYAIVVAETAAVMAVASLGLVAAVGISACIVWHFWKINKEKTD